MKIVDLKTDNRKDNNNVGRAIPVFSWRAEGTERNIRQKKLPASGMENGKP